MDFLTEIIKLATAALLLAKTLLELDSRSGADGPEDREDKKR